MTIYRQINSVNKLTLIEMFSNFSAGVTAYETFSIKRSAIEISKDGRLIQN